MLVHVLRPQVVEIVQNLSLESFVTSHFWMLNPANEPITEQKRQQEVVCGAVCASIQLCVGFKVLCCMLFAPIVGLVQGRALVAGTLLCLLTLILNYMW